MQMKRTDGWAAQYLGVGTNKELWCLRTGQCAQYGGERGGSVEKKKNSANPPVNF